MKKIAVLTCLDTCKVCDGASCLGAWNGRKGRFTRYAGEDVCLSAFFHCNGCDADPRSDTGMLEKLNQLQRDGVETVHVGVCAVKNRETGALCPNIEKIQNMLHDRGIKTILGTY